MGERVEILHWPALQTIGIVSREQTLPDGKQTSESSVFIISLPKSVGTLNFCGNTGEWRTNCMPGWSNQDVGGERTKNDYQRLCNEVMKLMVNKEPKQGILERIIINADT